MYYCTEADAFATEGEAGNGMFNSASEDGFSSASYTTISTDDANSVDSEGTVTGTYVYHRFEYTIAEDPGDIYQIDVTWKGYGKETGMVPIYRAELYVKDKGVYSEFDSHTQNSKQTLTAVNSTRPNDWIDSNGVLSVGAQCGFASYPKTGTICWLYSYYTEAKVYYYDAETKVHVYGGMLCPD